MHSLPIQKTKWHISASLSPGFTLIELTLTIAIIGTISAIALPLYADHLEKAKMTRAMAEIYMFAEAIYVFKMEEKRYPDSLTELGGPIPIDPWGNPYQYLNIDCGDFVMVGKIKKCSGKIPKGARTDKFLKPLNSDFDLYSVGKDGQTKKQLHHKLSWDDLIRANDGGYVGLATEF